MRAAPRSIFRTGRNLLAGLQVVMPMPVGRRSFHFSLGQAVALVVLDLLISVACDYLDTAPERHLRTYGLAVLGANDLVALLACYAIARLQRAPHTAAAFAVVLFSAGIAIRLALTAFNLAFGYDFRATPTTGWQSALMIVLLVWFCLMYARSLRLVYTTSFRRTLALTLLLIGLSVSMQSLLPDRSSWYSRLPPSAAASTRDDLDVEATYYSQRALLAERIEALAPQRPGVTDLYFVGFAGWGAQDVFMKEARAAQQLFDTRFDTTGRSLLLINNPETVDDQPLASVTNLQITLNAIGRRIDREEDVVFLYLTSHGSRGGWFSVDFGPLDLNDLSAKRLRAMLDHSGIKWRVVVISACYSGGFIDALKDDHTLVLTAARKDRTSFGCGDLNDFTYFGEAFLDHALRQERSFVAAFEAARAEIAEREHREDLTPSEPQIELGESIAAKLAALQGRLEHGPLAAAMP